MSNHSTSTSTPPCTLEVESGDALRLILHHLTESGLHDAARALQEESGIGAVATHSNLASLCKAGQWGEVLTCLQKLDKKRMYSSLKGNNNNIMAQVHEMTVLELAEMGEMDLARATLRLSMEELSEDMQLSIERRLQELSTLRRRAETKLPHDYYGNDNVSRQQRRDDLAQRLTDAVPIAPRGRLMALLQQAVKWQTHTGQLPIPMDILMEELSDADADAEEDDDGGNHKGGKKNKKRKKRKRGRTIAYDLVLGEPMIPSHGRYNNEGALALQSGTCINTGKLIDGVPPERIPSKQLGHIKFGKKSHPECAVFLPDGQGLATGSSDGFIEIWDPKKCKLRTHDMPYQQDDDLMLHDTAVLAINFSRDGEMLATGSSDGMVRVWKIMTGKCLRQFERAHSEAISCIAFNIDGTKVLTGAHDCICREFGLRASKMLKEIVTAPSYGS